MEKVGNGPLQIQVEIEKHEGWIAADHSAGELPRRVIRVVALVEGVRVVMGETSTYDVPEGTIVKW